MIIYDIHLVYQSLKPSKIIELYILKNTEFHFNLCRNNITTIENLIICFNIPKLHEKALITKVLHKGVDKALNEFRQEV